VHLAAGFSPSERSLVLKGVAEWGAGATTHGAALVAALAQTAPAPERITWSVAAASTRQPADFVGGDTLATGGGQLTSRLRASTSVTELCQFGGHVKDMDIIHLTVGANPKSSTLRLQPSTLNPQPSTLNPQPSTLNPQPSILNPQPSTMNPKRPQELHLLLACLPTSCIPPAPWTFDPDPNATHHSRPHTEPARGPCES